MGTPFTTAQTEYLRSLPAVERVSHDRIRYSDAFRHEAMRRYRMGERPTRIFRDNGLDPKLIGYKRIERCIARWNTDPDTTEETTDETTRTLEAIERRLAGLQRAIDDTRRQVQALEDRTPHQPAGRRH